MKKNILLIAYVLLNFYCAFAQSGNVLKITKYGRNINGFGDNLGAGQMGHSGVAIGDIDGNGICDIATSVYNFGLAEGNVYIILLNRDLSVKSKVRIGQNRGGFPNISLRSSFGKMCALGDIDKDGIPDIAVSDAEVGVIYILFLNSNGTVKLTKSFSGDDLGLNNGIYFGWSIDSIGDFSKDGGIDLIIGAPYDDDGGQDKGAIFFVNLTKDGVAQSAKKISTTIGGFHGIVKRFFGNGINCIGDLNKDSVADVVVSSFADNHPDYSNEEFWILFMNSNGTVRNHQKVSTDSGNLSLPLNTVLSGFVQPKYIGDIDNDGHNDIVASVYGDTIVGKAIGNSYILFLDSVGKVKSTKRLFSDTSSIYSGLDDGDQFWTLWGRGDLDGDYKNDLIMSAPRNDQTGANEGLLFVVSLEGAVYSVQPKARFTAKDTSGLTTKVFTFTNTSSGSPKQVKWSFTPNTVSYQNSTTETSLDSVLVKFNAAGKYTVKLWVQNPFGQDSLVKIDHITVNPIGGVYEATYNPFEVYPIPVTNEIFISGDENIRGKYFLCINNSLGERLSCKELEFIPNATQRISTEELPSGLYFLSISNSTNKYTLKFVK